MKKWLCCVLVVVLLGGWLPLLADRVVSGVPTLSPAATTKSDETELLMPNYDRAVVTKTDLPVPKVTTFGAHDADYYPSSIHKQSAWSYDNNTPAETKNAIDSKKRAIMLENIAMIYQAKTWFAEGTLKNNLQKHKSADGQFSANTDYANAPRIEKVITINNKVRSRRHSLGVFAPAGEVITITIDESLVNAGLTVYLGYPNSNSDIGSTGHYLLDEEGKRQKDENGKDIWVSYPDSRFDINQIGVGNWPNDRMAQFFMEFKLTQAVTYIGSPLGGMLSLNRSSDQLGNFNITISGGVDMPDYQLGISTQDDWKDILAAPGPYVWLLTPYHYFVMPKAYIMDIADPYLAMLWWHKVAMNSMYAIAREDTDHFLDPIISTYDSYVFVGAAVATVWAFVSNLPSSWCHGDLDYANLVANGSWGTIHEYNHHHQSHAYSSTEWGVGGIGEVTNNVLNAASYILMTDIAAKRSETNLTTDWPAVADPYTNYRKLLMDAEKVSTYEGLGNNKVFGFADIMHTFGAGKFLDFIRAQYGYGTVDGWTGSNLCQDGALTSMDNFALFMSLYYQTNFTSYLTKVWHFELSSTVVAQIKGYKFNEYFSLNNLYAAGIKGVETGRPYQIDADTTTVLKIADFTNCSADKWQLTRVTKPSSGQLTDNGDGTYSYTPNAGMTTDSFDLVYKVTLNGKAYTRTLIVKLAAKNQNAVTNVYPAYFDLQNTYLNRFYTNVMRYTPVTAECLDNDGNPVSTVAGADIMNLFDGDRSNGKGFHTTWSPASKITPYPHNYYFSFAEDISFNQINFFAANNGYQGYYSAGEYEIYTSTDGIKYKLLKADTNTLTNWVVDCGTVVHTKYLKFVVKSNARTDREAEFTNLTEIEFALDLGTDYQTYASADAALKYTGSWQTVAGDYVNGQARHTTNGKVTFDFTGTNLILYSTNDQSQIIVDGKTYTMAENHSAYTPSFVLGGLTAGTHKVVIEAQNMNLDLIKYNGPTKQPTNWGMLIVVLVVVVLLCVAVGCAVYFANQRKEQKRQTKAKPKTKPQPTTKPKSGTTWQPTQRAGSTGTRPTTNTPARKTTFTAQGHLKGK